MRTMRVGKMKLDTIFVFSALLLVFVTLLVIQIAIGVEKSLVAAQAVILAFLLAYARTRPL